MSNRDTEADYKAAYLAEYKGYVAAGKTERAEGVAAVLRKLGCDVGGAPVETKVVEPAHERAVEDAPKRRPSRPATKAVDPE